jgi:hypothetical protein
MLRPCSEGVRFAVIFPILTGPPSFASWENAEEMGSSGADEP